jgi:phosphoenolpyruvate carboxylase
VRQNANLLSDLLNEAIAYLDGEEAAKLVAKARKAASQETADGEAPRLDHLFADLSSDQAIFLAPGPGQPLDAGQYRRGRRRPPPPRRGRRPAGRRASPHPGRRRQALVAEGKSPAELTKVWPP